MLGWETVPVSADKNVAKGIYIRTSLCSALQLTKESLVTARRAKYSAVIRRLSMQFLLCAVSASSAPLRFNVMQNKFYRRGAEDAETAQRRDYCSTIRKQRIVVIGVGIAKAAA